MNAGYDGHVYRVLRFITLLVLGLAALTYGADRIVQGSTGEWFESDVNLRSRLALSGARPALVENWRSNPGRLSSLLAELAKDERIMGACACSGDGRTLARTDSYPDELSCAKLVPRIRAEGQHPEWGHWTSRESLDGRELHLSAHPLSDGDGELGYVILAHDLSFVARR